MKVTLPLRLHLVRHGETVWSLGGQHTGTTDLALTPNGEAQARSLTERLGPIGFSAVLVSPRLRARQTAELAGFGPTSEVEPALAEWDYGAYEGLRTVDIQRERTGWNVWRDGCPGGETPADVSARADRLIDRLSTLTGNVALFSHGQFGTALGMRWIGLPLIRAQHFPLHAASLSILARDAAHADRRVIELWNETVPEPPREFSPKSEG